MIAILLITITVGLTFGIFSTVFFLWIWLAGLPPALIVWIQAFLSVLAAFYLVRVLIIRAMDQNQNVLPMAEGWSRLTVVLMISIILCAITVLAIHCFKNPYGGWDARAIWNLHARFLFRGGENWRHMFDPTLSWSHPDYPFLLPSLVSAGWIVAGSETTFVPTVVSLIFTVATIGLSIAACCILRNDWHGLVAGIIVISTPDFFFTGSDQTADVPLSFYFLLTLVLIQFAEKWNKKSLLFLAGMSAAFAAWTKNEGLLFVFALFAAWFVSGFVTKREQIWRDTLKLLFGAAPVIAMILLLKIFVLPGGYLFEHPETFLPKLLDISRYVEIAHSMGKEILTFGGGPVSALLFLALLFIFVAVGDIKGKFQRAEVCALFVILFMLIGYFLVFVITPQDLRWHLDSALTRLFVQLWPIAVLAVGCYGISKNTSRPELSAISHSES